MVGKDDDEKESDHDMYQENENATNISFCIKSEQSFENFSQLESAGIKEYSGTIMDKRHHQDMSVEKTFKETIEKKPDGYFVRLPWKDNAHKLPDNKGIAVQQMKSPIIKLAKDPALLTNYHQIITQQCKGVNGTSR
ncbi:hypothetical protein DICVIV_09974 [Dictyocaulus viviparus]|uniref:Uncharacterized protein n=1 Tax=Dictyocaulus viviparus TaxID=29172 RepID=A0A0D8XHD4_DICVI|nr:hypothetical protein DICVIV_09974 [Dictyocaulus viviparus]